VFPCSRPQDRIGSDHNGVWRFAYADAVDAVRAVINAAGNFELDTNTNAGRIYRALYVDFGDPVPATPLLPPRSPCWSTGLSMPI
jgi:hypothetical protein